MEDTLAGRITGYLHELAGTHPDRSVGSAGNQESTAFFAETVAGFGWDIAREPFDCVVWEHGEAWLEVGGERFPLHVGPYSLACDVRAPLVAASTVEDLESESVRGAVVLMHGELASGQFMPRNFTFYNPESHQRVYRAIDEFAPAALVAATGQDLVLVGSQYPFNVFEDGDLDVPNAYLKDVDGECMLAHAGGQAHVVIDSSRVPSTGEYVIARKSADPERRLVLLAHIDSKKGSPGAVDNAVGVAALMGAAELLQDHAQGISVDIVPINGEDDYAHKGELMWVAENEGHWDEIVLSINVDDAGRAGQRTEVSFYGVPDDVETAVREAMEGRPGFVEGEPWFQSDHAIVAQKGRPAIALASSDMAGFMATACHTERDTVDLADPDAVAEIARFLADVAGRLPR